MFDLDESCNRSSMAYHLENKYKCMTELELIKQRMRVLDSEIRYHNQCIQTLNERMVGRSK